MCPPEAPVEIVKVRATKDGQGGAIEVHERADQRGTAGAEVGLTAAQGVSASWGSRATFYRWRARFGGLDVVGGPMAEVA